MTEDLHPAAAQGFAAQSQAYARGRPDYPAALDPWLRHQVGLAPGRTVLDLGAGTGKFTQRLIATGAQVLAVEPVAAMRSRLMQALPEVPALEGRAEALPLADASVDAIVCAQAFHWFANAQALAEMQRVLRPGGRLALVWNVRDEREPWVAALSALLAPHEGDAPRQHTGAWREAFAQAPARFAPLQQQMFVHAHAGPFETVVLDRLLSVSFIAALPDAERAAFAAQLRALRSREPALQAQTLRFPYRTEAWLTQRLP